MKYPKNELAQLVIASCINSAIEDIIISPGSRNAPLTIGFKSCSEIKTYSVVDERSAGFVALGIAQQKKKPVALLCTSGSALLNYYPAISEAFYSDIPLVVISADRPEHMIDIGDGQTIRQKNVFENHSLYNANLMETDFEENKLKLKTALSKATKEKGPVHINVPFDEPLYETVEDILKLAPEVIKKNPISFLEEEPLDVDFLQGYADKWNKASRKIVLIGSQYPDALLQVQLDHLTKDPSVLVLTETISNVGNNKFINSIDQLIFPLDTDDFEELKPDILLTLGGLIVSKKIKQFFRKFQPKEHWHVDAKKAFDSYQCLSKHFEISSQLFFSQFFFLTKIKESTFQNKWLAVKEERRLKHTAYLENIEFSDLKVHEILYKHIPKHVSLQLSNSSVIRYSQLFDIDSSIKVFCNRGTSGIDGSTSTAIGAAMANEEQTLFVTGDVSFFYDSNALWNSYIPKNFRILLINNNGGGIFKFIPGPSNSDALEYFETPHGLNAKHLCAMHAIEYNVVSDETALIECLGDFYKESEKPKLLEIHTPSEINDTILKAYFNNFK